MQRKDLWYKDAIIYTLDVESFYDSDGDGVGDFKGLTEKLPYIAGLGMTTIWLLPFYATPNKDNGYDVSDYYQVDPRLGTLGDFVEFTHLAAEYGIRIIIDLVINHTSIDHPWFQQAVKDRDSKYFDYYVWSDEKPKNIHEGMVFPGYQDSIWTYEKKVDAWYLHRFYEHQPDLNMANPQVVEEIRRVMGFWLKLGVSGFRIDAAPFVIEMLGIEHEGSTQTANYEYLRQMHDFLSWRRGDAVMLAEANIEMKEVKNYVGDGDKLQMLFHFMLNQHLFLALAQESAKPIIKVMQMPSEIPQSCQWVNFLRVHDELDLGRLSKKEREFVFEQFGPEEDMQLYGRGIRRRLAPMLENDRKKLELANSLLLTLPGTPVIRYGQEIGMGDDLSLPERDSVRTPMQWSKAKNGGFSTADRRRLVSPVINEGQFGYKNVNVEDQQRDDNSLLNWMEKAVRVRRHSPEFGYGTWSLIETGDDCVLAHRCDWEGKAVIAVHNLGGEPTEVHLKEQEGRNESWMDLIGDHRYQIVNGDPKRIELDSYGYRWFRVRREDEQQD
jgi:maltose alpha-D-glucosyltransferase/alpha-amylase